jgi:phospholipid/cholesterol/gamma-HCH transport system permease protein
LSGGLPFEEQQTPEGETVLIFKVALDYQHAGAVWKSLAGYLDRNPPAKLVLDLRNTPALDSAGIALLRWARSRCEERGISARIESAPESSRFFLHYSKPVKSKESKTEEPLSASVLVERLGSAALDFLTHTVDFFRFCGDFFLSTIRVLRTHRFRRQETLYYLQLSGAEAMGIVFLLSFLLGVVMTYQGAVELRQFGANIYVADLLSLVLARELAPVFTAVILAGRSGSAFAAEIGAMKVGEELDALVVMGFDLTEFITMPKVFALAAAAPLLVLWANFAGTAGGILIGIVSLDLTPYSFLNEIYTALTLRDIVSGLIKGEVFAVLVALTGCFRGFQTGKDADSVGRQTTAAVVMGIFLVILADAILTVLFNKIGW